jgi:hypothetical protein
VDKTSQLVYTVEKGRKDKDAFEYYQSSFEGIEQSEGELIEEAKVAENLLKHYFLRAREFKHINSGSLRTINKLASGFSFFRSFLREKGTVASK